MKISMILATDQHGAIGKNNQLLFKSKIDMDWFKFITENKVVIMGHNTFKSIGKPLKGRFNIVITSNKDLYKEVETDGKTSLLYCDSLQSAIDYCGFKGYNNIFIIGGAMIYNEALEKDLIDIVFLTTIKETFDADAFCIINKNYFKNIFKKEFTENGKKFTIEILKKD